MRRDRQLHVRAPQLAHRGRGLLDPLHPFEVVMREHHPLAMSLDELARHVVAELDVDEVDAGRNRALECSLTDRDSAVREDERPRRRPPDRIDVEVGDRFGPHLEAVVIGVDPCDRSQRRIETFLADGDEQLHALGRRRRAEILPRVEPSVPFATALKVERTEAIVLHTYSVRERDKIVIFLTPDRGKQKGLAYGARSIRNRFGAALEPLAKVRIGYIEKESDEIVRIESVDLVRSLFPAQQNLVSSVAATYIAELVDTFAQSDDPAELIYRLLDRSCEALLEAQPPLPVITYAEVWMLRLGGILPSQKTCFECGSEIGRPLRFDSRLQGFVCPDCAGRDTFIVSNEAADLLDAIQRRPVAEVAAASFPTEALLEVRSLAGGVRRNFLGHELKSFEVLASVLGGR